MYKYFSANSTDNWGDFSKISHKLLLELDLLREFIGHPIYVTSGYRPESNGSQHALGLAVDIVCPNLSLMDFFLAAERFNFKGLGVYPDWKYQGYVTGGLHVDQRTSATGARWMGTKDSGYIKLNLENLRKYGVV